MIFQVSCKWLSGGKGGSVFETYIIEADDINSAGKKLKEYLGQSADAVNFKMEIIQIDLTEPYQVF